MAAVPFCPYIRPARAAVTGPVFVIRLYGCRI
jgi:hypothetical protein